MPRNSIQKCFGGDTDADEPNESNVLKKLAKPTMTRNRPIAATIAPPTRSAERTPS